MPLWPIAVILGLVAAPFALYGLLVARREWVALRETIARMQHAVH